MRIRPAAQAVLDRALPNRLDSLWCEILASDYGAQLLEAWDLTLEQVRASAPVLTCDGADVLRWASRHSFLNSMICAAEWVAEDLVTSRRDWQGPPLSFFTEGDIEYHEVDIRDVYALAFDEGLEEALERHYLTAARSVWPTLDRILEFSLKPLAGYDRPYHSPARGGPLDVSQLASACLREERLFQWMLNLGICNWRLRANVNPRRMRYSDEKLRWMGPACEEARRLGSPGVGPDHLLLSLLGEVGGLPVRLLREFSVDLCALRRRLSVRTEQPLPVAEMVFAPALTAVFQAASALDGHDPHSGVLLQCLLEQVAYPEIEVAQVLPALKSRLAGLLPGRPEAISMDGLRLGMTEQEVLERLGPPAFHKETCWMYRHTSVHWREGKVEGLLGRRVEIEATGETLELGCHWLEAEPLLGALRLWNGGPGPLSALISGDRVRILTLSLDSTDE